MNSLLSLLSADIASAVVLWEKSPTLQGITPSERLSRRNGMDMLVAACTLLQEVPQLRCIQFTYSSFGYQAQALWTGEVIDFAVSAHVNKVVQDVQDKSWLLRMGAQMDRSSSSLSIEQILGAPQAQSVNLKSWEWDVATLPQRFRPVVGEATWAAMSEETLEQALSSSSLPIPSSRHRM